MPKGGAIKSGGAENKGNYSLVVSSLREDSGSPRNGFNKCPNAAVSTSLTTAVQAATCSKYVLWEFTKQDGECLSKKAFPESAPE